MNKRQYNNIIKNTLKRVHTEDSLSAARAVFKNMGVALPGGDMKEVFETVKTNNYMGWKSCTMEEAQAAANSGTAAIGISDSKIVVLAADDAEEPIEPTAEVLAITDSTPAVTVTGLQYYSYGYGSNTVIGNNTDYRGLQILSNSQLNLLNYNKKFYQNAANCYGIPWKLLAAIHYREYGLKREGPNNGNGPYQIWGKSYPIGTLSDSQFQNATNDAAKYIVSKANGRNLSIEDNVKYTLFAYNGLSNLYKTQALNLGFSQAKANIGEGSPYVMNRADCRRDPTVEPTRSNRTWGQIKSDGGSISYPANSDYGAFVVYSAI